MRAGQRLAKLAKLHPPNTLRPKPASPLAALSVPSSATRSAEMASRPPLLEKVRGTALDPLPHGRVGDLGRVDGGEPHRVAVQRDAGHFPRGATPCEHAASSAGVGPGSAFTCTTARTWLRTTVRDRMRAAARSLHRDDAGHPGRDAGSRQELDDREFAGRVAAPDQPCRGGSMPAPRPAGQREPIFVSPALGRRTADKAGKAASTLRTAYRS